MQNPIAEPIYTLKHLSIFLGIPLEVLNNLIDFAQTEYRPYKKTKKSGGYRIIDNPSDALKAPQKQIKKLLLELHTLPSAILGGVKGYGIKDYALVHVGQKELICLDIKNCFPSVTNKMVFSVFRNNYLFSEELASALTKLTTFRGKIPQGAPTSNLLLNIVIIPLCNEIEEICKKNNLKLSFWVDDVTISGNNARRVLQEIIPIFHKYGFAIKTKKTIVMPKSNQQTALGLVVNSKVSVSQQKYDQYISDFYNGISQDQILGRANHLEYINENQSKRFMKFVKKRLEDRI